VIAAVCLFIAAALLAAVSGLIGDEVRGWLELAPRGVLRLVALRLPKDQRPAIYAEEWLPELLFILRKAEGRPVTRLVAGTWFAVSMIRSAGRVGRTLGEVRKEPGRVVPSQPGIPQRQTDLVVSLLPTGGPSKRYRGSDRSASAGDLTETTGGEAPTWAANLHVGLLAAGGRRSRRRRG
jgi:hypothetical protein